ncbi:MAG TPA: urea ABC transporter permease subunit UrtC [Jatrophihabitans sp.]|jgi:urea transport system permease protein
MSSPTSPFDKFMTPAVRNAYPFVGWVICAVVLLLVFPNILGAVYISQFAQYCCLATVAVGIGMAWGRGGMLVLGQGLFFGLGAYMMAMHIQLADVPKGTAPAYLQNVGVFDDSTLPAFWDPFRVRATTILLIIVIPAVLAYAIGVAVFKRKVKGAFFAILSQALLYAFVTYINANQLQIGGVTGLTGLQHFFGLDLGSSDDQKLLYYIAAIVLLVSIALMIWLYRSRFGELLVAVRDAEERVRFLGYDPANIKLIAFVVSAMLAAFAGALYAPINQHIGTGDFSVTASIMMIIGVAVGGRTTLFGPPVGAIAIAYLQYKLSSEFPTFWQYFIGLLFIIVLAVLPGGIVDLPKLLKKAKYLVDDLLAKRKPATPAEVTS